METSSVIELGYGKIPPQAREYEDAILGACMLDKDALSEIVSILNKESFYNPISELIFTAILSLYDKNQPVNQLTVSERLREMGELDMVGGPYGISQLCSEISSQVTSGPQHYARIISQKHYMRQMIKYSQVIHKDAYDDTSDPFELMDKAEADLFAITQSRYGREMIPMSAVMSKSIKQIENAQKSKDGITGVPSGFPTVDSATGGWQPSDLIVVAARPGMGKTAFALALARNAAIDFSRPIAFFSLEMSSIQLGNRLLSAETLISTEILIRSNRMTEANWQTVNSKVEMLAQAPIFIDDTPSISIFELKAKARKLKMQHDIQMIVVDYIQLMTGDQGGNREQEISYISRNLKAVAKELDVPVIALSQLSRAVETRGGEKRPQLSDLRESGAIEQDADMVIFIYRPEYYGINEDANGKTLHGFTEVIIAKHRSGGLGSPQLRFHDSCAKFMTDQEWYKLTRSYRPQDWNDK